MAEMIAPCGLDCAECPGYQATQANDEAKIAEVAKMWSKEFNTEIKPENVWCDGCLADSERKCSHCAECDVRDCAVSKGVPNCAHCGDYGCETITKFFEFVPPAKEKLDAIRAGLSK